VQRIVKYGNIQNIVLTSGAEHFDITPSYKSYKLVKMVQFLAQPVHVAK